MIESFQGNQSYDSFVEEIEEWVENLFAISTLAIPLSLSFVRRRYTSPTLAIQFA